MEEKDKMIEELREEINNLNRQIEELNKLNNSMVNTITSYRERIEALKISYKTLIEKI
jgi:FtsZ-binding cell division protein ZapB